MLDPVQPLVGDLAEGDAARTLAALRGLDGAGVGELGGQDGRGAVVEVAVGELAAALGPAAVGGALEPCGAEPALVWRPSMRHFAS